MHLGVGMREDACTGVAMRTHVIVAVQDRYIGELLGGQIRTSGAFRCNLCLCMHPAINTSLSGLKLLVYEALTY